jgi:hypothetical protein
MQEALKAVLTFSLKHPLRRWSVSHQNKKLTKLTSRGESLLERFFKALLSGHTNLYILRVLPCPTSYELTSDVFAMASSEIAFFIQLNSWLIKHTQAYRAYRICTACIAKSSPTIQFAQLSFEKKSNPIGSGQQSDSHQR